MTSPNDITPPYWDGIYPARHSNGKLKQEMVVADIAVGSRVGVIGVTVQPYMVTHTSCPYTTG